VVRSLAALVFIGAVAAGGIFLATKKTVIKGEVMAASLLEQVKKNGVAKIVCDESIPVTPKGAVFTCQAYGDDGSTARIEYTMNREGGLAANMLDSTGPTRERPALPPGTDSWSH
jgi:hypothetical protein